MSFEDADLYTCDPDAEGYHAEDVSEAISEWLEHWDVTLDVLTHIRSEPLTVYAYKRMVVTPDWVHAQALHLAEVLRDQYCEEFAGDDENGDDENGAISLAQQNAESAIEGVVAAFVEAAAPVWSCEQAGKREYTSDEVEAMMRVANPEWFGEEQGT